MPRPPFGYRAATRLLRPLLPLAASFDVKLAQGLAGRRAFQSALPEAARRLAGSTVLHVHAASAGELRYAEPVIARLRRAHPAWRWVITYFSPSAAPFAAELAPDLHGHLPWDTPAEVAPFLGTLPLTASLVSRLDLWPEFAAQAARRRIPVILLAAGMRADSGRLGVLGRHALGPAYASVAAAAAVADEDVRRLERLGIPRDRIHVLGDPRADQVRERVARDEPARRWPALVAGGPLLVAGSTWPPDEQVLLAAFREVRQLHPAARLLLAPHRPEPSALAAMARDARALGLPAPQPVAEAPADAPLLVLDQVGPLGLLYGAGLMAYVGGGFGRGLHSVLEPAAWSLPVLVGPRWRGHADAERLAAAGGLVGLPAGGATAALVEHWARWLTTENDRAVAGAAARSVVDAAAGAADRTAGLVEAVLAGY